MTTLASIGDKLKTAAAPLTDAVAQAIPTKIRDTLGVRAFAFLKIPLLFYVRPVVEELSDERCVLRIALNRRTRNHLGSMYFGTLCCGADLAGGLNALRLMERTKAPVNLVFKDFQAEFLKRPEADVLFTCEQGAEIAALLQKAVDTGERQNLAVHIVATCPDKMGTEPVAKFTLTLSLKRRESKKG